jgi:dethiobiotin synthetase
VGKLVIITGTDTGVGKTWVGCALGEAMYGSGRDVRAIKLVETGTPEEPSPLEDGTLLARATRQAAPLEALRRYRTPVAAAEAAEMEGRPFDLTDTITEVQAIAAGAEFTFVEGAGGLFAPLTWRRNLLDVARRLGAPVIVVAADRLGTLNHTLLTLAMLDLAGLTCPGVVMNAMPGAHGDDHSRGRNADAVRRVRPDIPVVETTSPKWVEEVMGWVG